MLDELNQELEILRQENEDLKKRFFSLWEKYNTEIGTTQRLRRIIHHSDEITNNLMERCISRGRLAEDRAEGTRLVNFSKDSNLN